MGWVKHSIFKSTKQQPPVQLCTLSWPEHPRVCRDLPWWGPSPWSWSAGFSPASQHTGAGAGCHAARWTERCAPESIPVVIINAIHVTHLQRWVQGTEPKLGHHKKGQTGPEQTSGPRNNCCCLQLGGDPKKMSKYFDLQAFYSCSINISVFFQHLCNRNTFLLWTMWVHSSPTNKKTGGSWHRRHLYLTCQPCSWHRRHRLPVTKW